MEFLIAVAVLVFAIPLGIILKNITKEEISAGKKYFKLGWIASLILALFIFFLDLQKTSKYPTIFTLLFISIICFINWK